MSQGRIELTKLLSSNQPVSTYYWISLLNVFKQNKENLDILDIKQLVAECERCRLEFNIENRDPIRKEDTRPNVYSYLDDLETKLEEEHNKESLPTNLVAVAQ